MSSKFITNDKENNLKKRISQLIEHSEEMRFLVGFFYFSGVRELYESIKNNPNNQIDILVGLNVDKQIYGLVEYGDKDKGLSREESFGRFLDSVHKSLTDHDLDNSNFYEQIKFFLQLIKEDKIRIRKTREPNHAKLYLFRLTEQAGIGSRDIFITGSSNLTSAGLSGQQEFNVEISDSGVEEAKKYFDELWGDADKITEIIEYKTRLVDLIENKTMAAEFTPFEAFVLVLKNYLERYSSKTPRQKVENILTSAGYKPYEYQIDAIIQALGVIEDHGGVMVCDVVGLGKSVVAGALGRILNRRGLIISPPGLVGEENISGWKKYQTDFDIKDWRVVSCGTETLEKALEFVHNNPDIEIIIIDEVHRFRNEDTRAYELLKNICRNKKVILLTATPFNNSPADIFSLLQLFIVPGKSTITLDNNLKDKFRSYNELYKKLSNIRKNHSSPDKRKKDEAFRTFEKIFGDKNINLIRTNERSSKLAGEIRSILEPVMIRRNRLDLKNDPIYKKEIDTLSELKDPIEAFFVLNTKQLAFYEDIVSKYFGSESREFRGAIYQPFSYETGIKNSEKIEGEKENFEYLSQRNLFDFMRRLLVKRFESSFGAFEKSIDNFLKVHEKVAGFIKNSNGKFILDRKLMENIYNLDEEDIDSELSDYEDRLGEGNYPKHYKIYDLEKFKDRENFEKHIESDRKMFAKIKKELVELDLSSDDPKFEALVDVIKKEIKKESSNKPVRKVVIFTEYSDTAKYLEDKLEARFPGRILSIAHGLSAAKREEILRDFDASYSKKNNKYDILLATDKISEGFNLNRAGTVYNYDIPWNPTRVIQRVGRINRIGKKVFDELHIFNFFPTEKGATHVRSKEIAQQKMFLIHNALGEDAKIFDVDEEPTPAGLFKKIQTNPDELEAESFFTKTRKLFNEIIEKYPLVLEKLQDAPSRIKTAKKYKEDALLIFIKKAGNLYSRGYNKNEEKIVEYTNFEDVLAMVECDFTEKKLELSNNFWDQYVQVRDYNDKSRVPTGENSIERQSLTVLQGFDNNPNKNFSHYSRFLDNLREDIADYQTLPKSTMRRIVNLKLDTNNSKEVENVKKELDQMIFELGGSDYLKQTKSKGEPQKEVIIAIENIK
ncbi:MAG: helicase-related protein [bacterium]|nr:helicase-related protein [bacterium]